MKTQDAFQMEGMKTGKSHKDQLESLSVPSGTKVTFHMFHTNHLDLDWYWRLPKVTEMR